MHLNQNTFFGLLFDTQLYSEPPNTKPLIVLNKDVHQLDKQEGALFEKILLSIGYSIASVEVIAESTIDLTSEKVRNHDRPFVLRFTSGQTTVTQEGAFIVVPSLPQLHYNDEAKKALWNVIKGYKRG